ncbi:protein kinase subdomain-containing protein PKL/ccin9 [Chiua virens]|nr:protein kinase subdomain-containing protein PKL/ccin9 [Chiua virens]
MSTSSSTFPPVPRKRTAEEDPALYCIKHARIATTIAPSKIDVSTYAALQGDPKERILDDRAIAGVAGGTALDDRVPPIPLIYQPFGTFLDTYFDTALEVNGLLKRQVDEALIHLNRIFKEALGVSVPSLSPTAPAGISKCRSDGHIVGSHDMPILLVELKNEEAGIKSVPIAELSGYYCRLLGNIDDDRLLRSRVPALGLTLVGPMITFYALAYPSRLHYTELTATLSCRPRAVNGNARKQLYNAFAAAVHLVGRITQDAASGLPSSPLKDHLYPAISELPSYGHSTLPIGSIRFEIVETIMAVPGRYVYLARASDGTMLVVKFSRSYSIHLHHHCFLRGHAPALHGYAKLPGNIHAIAMEYVHNATPLDPHTSFDDRKEWAKQLTALVRSFHAKDYVHGDLRSPNIVVAADNRVRLLDYDWGGKQGQVFYPHEHLNPQLTQDRNRTDLKIEKDDDERVLHITLKEIGMDLQL